MVNLVIQYLSDLCSVVYLYRAGWHVARDYVFGCALFDRQFCRQIARERIHSCASLVKCYVIGFSKRVKHLRQLRARFDRAGKNYTFCCHGVPFGL